jgi:hypothetical protein
VTWSGGEKEMIIKSMFLGECVWQSENPEENRKKKLKNFT